MGNEALFGYLANKSYQHPENLAAESLNYILNESSNARKALINFLNQSTIEFPKTYSDAKGLRSVAGRGYYILFMFPDVLLFSMLAYGVMIENSGPFGRCFSY